MTRRPFVLFFSLCILAVLFGLASADEFRWTEDLDAAFVSANDKGRLVLVLASEDLTDTRAVSAARALGSPGAAALLASFVGVRLSGDAARAFAERYAVRELPAAAVLAPSGSKITEVLPGSLGDLLPELAKAAGRTRIEANPFELADKMRRISARLSSKPDLDVLADQYGVLLSLDRLIEQARPRKSKQAAGPLMPRGDGEGHDKAGAGEGKGGGGGGGSGDGKPGKGAKGTSAVSSAQWGRLPPRLREDAADSSVEEIPPAYREIVEEYFKKLMR